MDLNLGHVIYTLFRSMLTCRLWLENLGISGPKLSLQRNVNADYQLLLLPVQTTRPHLLVQTVKCQGWWVWSCFICGLMAKNSNCWHFAIYNLQQQICMPYPSLSFLAIARLHWYCTSCRNQPCWCYHLGRYMKNVLLKGLEENHHCLMATHPLPIYFFSSAGDLLKRCYWVDTSWFPHYMECYCNFF